MLRKMIRRGGMLALVLALALAGTAPAAALDFSGRNLDRLQTVWSWLTDLLGWDGEAGGASGGLASVHENEGIGIDPNGKPTASECPSCEEGVGIDPNG